MEDWDWEGLQTAPDIEPDTAEKVRQLGLKRRQNFTLHAFLRLVIPEHWARYRDLDLLIAPRENHTDYIVWLTGLSPEPNSIDALTLAVTEEPCLILDVGANSGTYAIPLARAAVPGSAVLAFEPNPVMAARLRQSIDRNGLSDKITVHECAISDQSGEALLYLAGTNFGEASLNAGNGTAENTLSVRKAALLDFIDAAETRPIVLKIDIEGHEDRALMPLLEQADDHLLPRVMMVETRHRNKWRRNLGKRLKQLSYWDLLQTEGNTMYMRIN
jgi:FkbM family methyltransferase